MVPRSKSNISHLREISTRGTPQSEPIPGSTQVPNSAGGYAYAIDDWGRLDRFLILGSAGGTYYIKERKLTQENADVVSRCIALDGPRTVARITEISEAGRAPKNDPAIFALAMCFAQGNGATKRLAERALPKVCRIGTHLFHFAQFVEQFRGWGPVLRRAVGNWYRQDISDLAFQTVKYRQRDGWSHRDLLRVSHPKTQDEDRKRLFDWICERDVDEELLVPVVRGYEALQRETGPEGAAGLIEKFGLPWETVPPNLLQTPVVWDALLPKMGLTALIRNLGNMSKCGLLVQGSEAAKTVTNRLADQRGITKSRVHPIAVLAALLTYGKGSGYRGSGTWKPVTSVVDALDGAFYLAFGNVDSAGKRIMLSLDVSGSMGWSEIASIPGLTPRVGSAAMALITQATEKESFMTAFSAGENGISALNISARQRLDDVVRYIETVPMGGTDCSLPMFYAEEQGLDIDAFVIYTDSETWAGSVHPTQALARYRQKRGIPARLVVVGMLSNGFTIADPEDAGMLDVVGFDTSSPQLIADFAGAKL